MRALEARTWSAWQAQDAEHFEAMLSDDHLDVHASGPVPKAAVVAAVRARTCRVERYALGPMRAMRAAPDAILVTYRAEQETTCGTVRVPSPAWVSSLWVRREGRWRNLLFQQTPAR